MTVAEFIIQFLVAVGTILVAVLAVYGEWFRFKFASPKLAIGFHNLAGELTRFGDGSPVRYYHLKIGNHRAWAPARNVRVLVRSILKPAADGTFTQGSEIGGLQLTWCFPAHGPMYRQIGPDEFCDLGFVTPDRFQFSTYITPNNFAGVLSQQGRLCAELLAVADNGRSSPVYIEVHWDSKWNDGTAEMARHLVIKQLDRPPQAPRNGAP